MNAARHRSCSLPRLAIAGILYALLAAATIHLTSDGRSIATVWPPNAVLLTLLLLERRSDWGRIAMVGFAANVAANLLTRGLSFAPFFYSAANVVEVLVAASLMPRGMMRDSILQSPLVLARFVFGAGLVAPLTSGVIGAATACLIVGQPLAVSFTTWMLSDALGLLVFTPLFLALARGDLVTCFREKNWRKRGEGIALLALTAAIAGQVFFLAKHPLLFALFPPLMLVTFRVGRLGTKLAVALVAVIGGVATMKGHGPIVLLASDATAQAHLFQAFLAVMLLTCLPVAAEITARARLTAQLAAKQRELEHRATTDPLTALLNRGGFQARADEVLRDRGGAASLVAIDLDHFKTINDRWGHHVGDRALVHLAAVLQSHVRGGDLVGRIGGDEFMVLLRGGDLDHARMVSERILAAVRRAPLVIDEVASTMIGVSVGVASAAHGERYDQLARRADAALYAAKAAGRGAVRCAA